MPMNGKPGKAGRTAKAPLTKEERRRRIKAIQAGFEAQRRELGMKAPSFHRGPAFYLGLMAVMAILGLSLVRTAEKGGSSGKVLSGKIVQATRSLDAFAEALGRFKFHTGEYPSIAEGGLEALASKEVTRKGWVGPYIHKRVWNEPLPKDPWKNAWVYDPACDTNGVPTLLSCGPDGQRGTADDILPDRALFSKPFRDTTWTNDWAPYRLRGIIVVPKKK